MKRYPVTSPIHHNGKRYGVGDGIDLSDAEAEKLKKSIDKDAGKDPGASAAAKKTESKKADPKKAAATKAPAQKDAPAGNSPEGKDNGGK